MHQNHSLDGTRHPICREQIPLNDEAAAMLDKAEQLESVGNWYLAGEMYRALGRAFGSVQGPENGCRVLARAATCFEVAGQHRPAARAYFDAASVLDTAQIQGQIAGELYNRAAHHFGAIGEYFNAGDSWRRAGKAFTEVREGVVAPDPVAPLATANNFTLAGLCYMAAGDAFASATGQEKWACMAYWESGRAHANHHRGHHSSLGYKKALTAAARFYRTHERREMRSYLPLTEEERVGQVDPLVLLEEEARLGHEAHRAMNAGVLGENWAKIATHRDMAEAYHDFYLAFMSIGNASEASACRALEKERMRQIHLLEKHYHKALLYTLWSVLAGYGESLFRWAATCVVALIGFAAIYAGFDLVSPVNHWFDYAYFSVVTFTSLGYGDIRPLGLWGKALACAEIMIGLVMFGLLLTFIGNRIQRT